MKIYTQKELNQICTTFVGWLYEYDKRFLYAILKQDKRRPDSRDYMGDPLMTYKEWYKKFGKDFQKVMKKYGEEKIKKAMVEIRHYLTFIITEFVENYFTDKKQYRYFVDKIREQALELLEREFGVQSDSNAFLKYAVDKNHIERIGHDLVDILGIGYRILEVQLRITALFGLFSIHMLPVFIKAIFEGNLQYIDTREYMNTESEPIK